MQRAIHHFQGYYRGNQRKKCCVTLRTRRPSAQLPICTPQLRIRYGVTTTALQGDTYNDEGFGGYYIYYYSEDDEEFDVAVQKVPSARGGVFGVEFVVSNATLGDCMFVLVPTPEALQPGCPPESAEKRRAKKYLWYKFGANESLSEASPPDAAGFESFFYNEVAGVNAASTRVIHACIQPLAACQSRPEQHKLLRHRTPHWTLQHLQKEGR